MDPIEPPHPYFVGTVYTFPIFINSSESYHLPFLLLAPHSQIVMPKDVGREIVYHSQRTRHLVQASTIFLHDISIYSTCVHGAKDSGHRHPTGNHNFCTPKNNNVSCFIIGHRMSNRSKGSMYENYSPEQNKKTEKLNPKHLKHLSPLNLVFIEESQK